MAAERIEHELRGRGIIISHSVFTYPGNEGSVYYGTFQNLPVGIKVKHYSEHNPAAPQEYQLWKEMQHPNVIRLYDCFWAWNGTLWYLVFVMEWCQWDAAQDIAKRKEENRPFTEAELWKVTQGLVDALSLMQSRSFTHHNLKLQNIYPFPDEPKIGDFSRCHFVDRSAFKTIEKDVNSTSVSPFLSPELRCVWAYHLAYMDGNSFKADAYSLGVVLLSLAKLEVPECFQQVHVMEDAVKTAIDELSYSEKFKQTMRCLLADNLDYRWDFMQLSVVVWQAPMANLGGLQALVRDIPKKLAVQEEEKSAPAEILVEPSEAQEGHDVPSFPLPKQATPKAEESKQAAPKAENPKPVAPKAEKPKSDLSK
jgi:serine/threonine protein kinase